MKYLRTYRGFEFVYGPDRIRSYVDLEVTDARAVVLIDAATAANVALEVFDYPRPPDSDAPLTLSLVIRAELAQTGAEAAAQSATTAATAAAAASTTAAAAAETATAITGLDTVAEALAATDADATSAYRQQHDARHGPGGGVPTRNAHIPALGIYFPEAEGATGDGVANDAAAFQAAIDAAAAAGGGRVMVSARTTGYLSGAFTIKTGVSLVGGPGALVKKSGTAGNWVTFQTDTTAQDVTFDLAGATTTNILYTGASARVTITGNRMLGAANGVRVIDGATDVLIGDNLFDGCVTGVHAGSAELARIYVRGNRFVNWTQRCVYIAGTATQKVSDFFIEDNVMSDCVGLEVNGDPRQPIGIQGNDVMLHRRVTVSRNHITGNGLAYAANGTADQISLHRTEGFVVADNLLSNGGEVGITVAQGSKNGSVTGNTVVRHDSVGICIGSEASLVTTTNVTVSGNTVTDNCLDRGSTQQGWPRTQAGILLASTTNVTVAGNECGDSTGPNKQVYAVALRETVRSTVGANGHDTAYPHYVEGVNTRPRWVVPPHVIAKGVDETVNNTATLQNDDDFVFDVCNGATYQIEGLLAYNSSQVADLQLGWTLPAGTSLLWIADGPVSTTTSPNGSVSRTRLIGASSAPVGGTGGNAVVAVRGVLTIPSAAVPAPVTVVGQGQVRLRWAQNTAEATATTILAGSSLTLTRTA